MVRSRRKSTVRSRWLLREIAMYEFFFTHRMVTYYTVVTSLNNYISVETDRIVHDC